MSELDKELQEAIKLLTPSETAEKKKAVALARAILDKFGIPGALAMTEAVSEYSKKLGEN